MDESNSSPTPEERVSQVRTLVSHRLSSKTKEHSEDLDHLVRSVVALLATNKEIKTRCEAARSETSQDKDWLLERECFQHVILRRCGDDGIHEFSACAQHQEMNFGSPPPVPPDLVDLVTVRTESLGTWVAYDQYFERALLLYDAVLIPFLATFKTHLEELQSFLGRMEAWLVEPDEFVAYVETSFGKSPVLPPHSERDNTQHRIYKCESCERYGGCTQPEHKKAPEYARNWRCSCCGRSGLATWLYQEKLGGYQIEGEYTASFDLGTATGRQRLDLFLQFVAFSKNESNG